MSKSNKSKFAQIAKITINALATLALLVAVYLITTGGVKYSDYGQSKFGSIGQEKESDGVVYVITYKGLFNHQSSEIFAEQVDSLLPRLKDSDVVILNVESNGGSMSASIHSYTQIERIKSYGVKVIGVSDYAANSGGYMLLSAADMIVIGPGANIGNIGVVRAHSVQDKPLIGSSRTKELLAGRTPRKGDIETIRSMVMESYRLFVDLVMKERGDNITEGNFKEAVSGKAFRGRYAVDIGLADKIGDKRHLLMSAYLDGKAVIEVKYQVPIIQQILN